MSALPLPLFAPPPAAVPAVSAQPAMTQPVPVTSEPAAATPTRAAPALSHRVSPPPESLHPALWRAHQLGGGRDSVCATGFAALDAELPGGGWPHRVLTELLLPQHGIGELRLLAPMLRDIIRAERTPMLFDPPARLCAPGWQQLGIDVRRMVLVVGRRRAIGPEGASASPAPPQLRGRARELLPQADVLWALEQALRSGHVGAILAWLPARLRADALRRLQLAAQSHDAPVFLLREATALARPSPAPLRLVLQPGAPDVLSLRIVKRRGPAMTQPLRLALPPVVPVALSGRVEPPAAAQAVRPARPHTPSPTWA